MVSLYSPLTWGYYDEPPPDIPECGFVGELCSPSERGKLSLPEAAIINYLFVSSWRELIITSYVMSGIDCIQLR